MGILGSLARGSARAGSKAGRLWLGRAAVVLAIAEALLAARAHLLERLTPEERARMIEIVKRSKGRPSNLTQAEKDELKALISKAQVTHMAVKTAKAGATGYTPKKRKRPPV